MSEQAKGPQEPNVYKDFGQFLGLLKSTTHLEPNLLSMPLVNGYMYEKQWSYRA